MPKKKQIAISIKKLNKFFDLGDRKLHALIDVDLEVYQGEFLIIFGPSGCGKTTLLNSISGLEEPSSGQVKTYGFDMWSLEEDDRASQRKNIMGIVYQTQNWIKSLSILDNLIFAASLLGYSTKESTTKTLTSLRELGLSDKADYLSTELSSGEQQKVSMARALLGDPQLIIADEPTGNLDIKSGHDLMEDLQKMVTKGKTVVMVTHNPEYLGYADRSILMLDGKINKIESKKGIVSLEKDFVDVISTYTGERKIVADNSKEEDSTAKEKLPFKKTLLQDFKFLFQIWPALFSVITSRFTVNDREKTKLHEGLTREQMLILSYKNLRAKRSRSLFTVFATSVGIGFVTLLLSLGFGLERLVVDSIAKAEGLRQIEVLPSPSSNILITDEVLKDLEKTPHVESVNPIASLAAKTQYSGSELDSVAFAVEQEYIALSGLKKEVGELDKAFEDEMGIVVSEDLLSALSLSRNDAVGEELELSIFSNDLKEEETVTDTFTISAVISETEAPVIYLSLGYLREVGLDNYSQVVLTTEDEQYSESIRHSLELQGYSTSSVTDTITQIEKVFSIARQALFIVGSIALVIAIVGMLNTLTISLLERTREIGFMKILGVKRQEIREIMISESILLGITGATLGLAFGFVIGKLLDLVLTVIATTNGGTVISVTAFPVTLLLLILVLGTLVGYFTGIYPANRAAKMSPLQAIRYE